jgi:hypothetical protein
LGGIVAEGGGDWKEAVKEGLECAMKQLKWRADAKKVIIIVGSSPPHDKDLPAIRNAHRRLAESQRLRQHDRRELPAAREHERRIHRWTFGDELKEVSPMPTSTTSCRSRSRHRPPGRRARTSRSADDRRSCRTSSCWRSARNGRRKSAASRAAADDNDIEEHHHGPMTRTTTLLDPALAGQTARPRAERLEPDPAGRSRPIR